MAPNNPSRKTSPLSLPVFIFGTPAVRGGIDFLYGLSV